MEIIEINTPNQISSKAVYNKIKSAISNGTKSSEILLQMNFICDNPKVIIDKFRVIKNRICFERDMNNISLTSTK